MSADKIRVCYIVSSLSNSGPVNVLFNIIENLDCSLFDVSVVTLTKERDNSRASEFGRLGVDVHLASELHGRHLISRIWALKALIRSLKPHLLHAHCPRSLLTASILLRQTRLVYTAHVFPGIQQYALYGRAIGFLVIHGSNFFMRRASLALACSTSVAAEFQQGLGLEVTAVPNGCAFEPWDQNETEKSDLRYKLGLEAGVRYFIFVGRFSDEKNPRLLADTFEAADVDDVQLIMLGDGPLLEEMKGKRYSKVRLEGFTNSVDEYLKCSDYYVSASRTEGLANTLLESMAIGLPVLLSNIPSHTHVMEGTERAMGFMFDPASPDDLTQKIRALVRCDRSKLSRNVQEEFQEKYTARRMAEGYAREYIALQT